MTFLTTKMEYSPISDPQMKRHMCVDNLGYSMDNFQQENIQKKRAR